MEFVRLTEQETEDFLQRCGRRVVLSQMPAYVRARRDLYRSEYVGVRRDGQVAASAVLVYQPWKKFFFRAKILFGPVLDFGDRELVAFFFLSLRRYLRRRPRVISLRVNPMLPLRFYRDIEPLGMNPEAEWWEAWMEKQGARRVRRDDIEDSDVQVRFFYTKDLRGLSEERVAETTGKKFFFGFPAGLHVELLPPEKGEVLRQLMNQTMERKGLEAISESSHRLAARLHEQNPDSVYLAAAVLETKPYLEELRADWAAADAALEAALLPLPEGSAPRSARRAAREADEAKKKKAALERRIEALCRLREERGERVVAAAALFIETPSDFIYYVGGQDSALSFVPAGYAIHGYMLREAIRRGHRLYNMFGVSGRTDADASDAGVLRFKRALHGDLEELVRSYDWAMWPSVLAEKTGAID